MITCLSKRLPAWGIALGLTWGLAGCENGVPGSARALSEALLAGNALNLVGPDGWCIEPRSLRNSARESFALIAGCRELTGADRFSESPPGYATVAVGAHQGGDLTAEVLLRYALGAAGQDTRLTRQGDILLAKPPGETGPHWRAATMVAGWPVLISVHGDAPSLASEGGARLARDLAEALTPAAEARPETRPNTPAETPTEARSEDTILAETDESAPPGLDLGDVFGRLLN